MRGNDQVLKPFIADDGGAAGANNVVANGSSWPPLSLLVSSGTLAATSFTLTAQSSTSLFPTTGTLSVVHNGVAYSVAYTNISGSTFTGCTVAGLSGTVALTSGDAINWPSGHDLSVDGLNPTAYLRLGYARYRAAVYADQAGTLTIQYARDDGSGAPGFWRNSATIGTTASVLTTLESLVTRRWVRAVWTNSGGSSTTVFELDGAAVSI